MKKRAMATKGKKPVARFDSDTERKLIHVWADIKGEFSTVHLPSQDSSSP